MATKKTVFIAFAIEDVSQRDLLKGQSLNTESPFEYIDMSVKEPYDSAWKKRVRTRIGAQTVLSPLSARTHRPHRARSGRLIARRTKTRNSSVSGPTRTTGPDRYSRGTPHHCVDLGWHRELHRRSLISDKDEYPGVSMRKALVVGINYYKGVLPFSGVSRMRVPSRPFSNGMVMTALTSMFTFLLRRRRMMQYRGRI